MTLVTIMMPLLDEAVDVWRPVHAEALPDSTYRIVSENSDPEDEHWAFTTGQLVLCKERAFEGGKYLVPVSLAGDVA
jgi:hypothetical protein